MFPMKHIIFMFPSNDVKQESERPSEREREREREKSKGGGSNNRSLVYTSRYFPPSVIVVGDAR